MKIKIPFICLFFSLLVLNSCSKDDEKATVLPEIKILAEASTNSVSSVTKTGAIIQATVLKAGSHAVEERGLVLDTFDNPTLKKGLKISAGYGLGTFDVWAKGLKSGRKYFVKAYAISSAGTAYGQELNFTTLSEPFVTTKIISNLNSTSVKSGGDVTADFGKEVTEKGLCWSKTENPTVSNSKLVSEKIGLGTFELEITELEKNTEYYLRAYAKSELGVGYGKQIKFKTIE